MQRSNRLQLRLRRRDGASHRNRARAIGRGALEGAIASMAMSGVRLFTTEMGWVKQVPPEAIVGQRARPALRRLPRRYRRAAIELLHWAYGSGGGAAFGALPAVLRRRRFAGIGYGLGLWLGFEALLAPALGLERTRTRPVAERVATAADHALYGFIVSHSRGVGHIADATPRTGDVQISADSDDPQPWPRTPAEVFADHLALVQARRIDDDLRRNYADHSVLITSDEVFRGRQGLRRAAIKLERDLGDARFDYVTRRVEGPVAYLEWAARVGSRVVVEDGVDTLVIVDGRVVTHTVHYTLTSRVATPRRA